MIEFADERGQQEIEEARRARLKLPYKVEVEWPASGGIWVGVTVHIEYPTLGNCDETVGKKFDREDTIGDVRDWIHQVRLGEAQS